MIRLHLAMPLLAIQLASVDAAAEETANARRSARGFAWSLPGAHPGAHSGTHSKAHSGGHFDIAAAGDFVTVSRDLSGRGTLRKTGQGELRLTGTNRYTGGTLVEQGVLRVGDGRRAGSIAGDIVNHGLLEFDREDSMVLSGRISGIGAVHYVGSGSVTVTGDHRYTGITVLVDGVLRLGDGGERGTLTGDIYNNGGQLVFDRRDTLTVPGGLHGHGAIIQAGAGTTVLGSRNTARGAVRVASGTLRTAVAGALGPAMRVVVAPGATLDTAGMPQTIAGLSNAGVVTLGDATPNVVAPNAVSPNAVAPNAVAPGVATPGVATPGVATPGVMSGIAPPGVVPGNALTVRGNYTGHGGVLRLRTSLSGSGSATDRLVIDGGQARGRTTVAIINVGGLGASTTGDGIEVVRAINGATTTAQTTRDAFVLQGGHVDAGAYEYRLYAGDANGAGESWYLRSTLEAVPAMADGGQADPARETPPGPGHGAAAEATDGTRRAAASAPPDAKSDPGGAAAGGRTDSAARIAAGRAGIRRRPAYRPETALYAALPAVLLQVDLASLGNLHRRTGDGAISTLDDTGADTAPSRRRAWARLIDQRTRIRQHGTVAPRSDGWTSGVQLGADLYASAHQRLGLYGGTLGWRHDVHGDAGGVRDRAAGRLRGRSDHIAAYWTRFDPSGWYADAVLQHSRQRGDGQSTGNAGPGTRADIRGHATLLSLEAGVPVYLGQRWTAEPQAQVVGALRHIDAADLPGATVRQQPGQAAIVRLGVRLSADYAGSYGRIQPYTRLNLWHGLAGTDAQSIEGPAGTARIEEARGYVSAELAVGGSWAMNRHIGLYGEIGRLMPLGGAQRVSAGHAVSAGVRIAW